MVDDNSSISLVDIDENKLFEQQEKRILVNHKILLIFILVIGIINIIMLITIISIGTWVYYNNNIDEIMKYVNEWPDKIEYLVNYACSYLNECQE